MGCYTQLEYRCQQPCHVEYLFYILFYYYYSYSLVSNNLFPCVRGMEVNRHTNISYTSYTSIWWEGLMLHVSSEVESKL